jgi:hypothetical protein
MFRVLRNGSQFRQVWKLRYHFIYSRKLGFYSAAFDAELQNSLMAWSGVRLLWQYIASLCMVQRFLVTLVQLVTDVFCVGLHCDAEGWSHLVTDHLFGPLQEQPEGRQLHGYEEVEIALCEWLQKF